MIRRVSRANCYPFHREFDACSMEETSKMLTSTLSLRERLAVAQAREREARAAAARIRREMAAADRRLETQRLCTLGRAWLVWGERDDRFRAAAARFLASYITRETDRAALAGSAWELAEPPSHGEAPAEAAPAEHGQGARHE
ncbi:hypothetical protein ACFQU7_08790 [Pseudoroseomonas wenyumeiae]